MKEPPSLTLNEYQALIPSKIHWDQLNANVLKRMFRVFVGKEAAKANKEACIVGLRRIFSEPGVFRKLLDHLTPLQSAGISSLVLSGRQVAFVDVLAGEMVVHAHAPDAVGNFSYSFGYGNSARQIVNELLESGIMFRIDGRPGAISTYDYSPVLFAPPELLEHAKLTPPVALDISPTSSIRSIAKKSPTEVSLRHVAFGQAFELFGPVPVTAKGLPGKSPISKIEKHLGWDREQKSGSLFRQPVNFFLGLWRAAGLIDFDPAKRELRLNERRWRLLDSPPADQARIWADAYPNLGLWIEYAESDYHYDYNEQNPRPSIYNCMRGALIRGLAALPDPDQWYYVDDFSRSIHARAGRYLQLSHRRSFDRIYGISASVRKELEEKWAREDLAAWRKSEGEWIRQALIGPLVHLGLVELGGESADRSPEAGAFRLTPLGRSAIWDVFRPGTVRKTEVVEFAGGGWVVQANFEAIVYLDRVTPRQVAFLERIAERVRVDSVTAVYRLNRESVYRGLESGIGLDELRETLVGGSLHPLPDNVLRALSDWGRRREQLTLRREATLLEFQSSEARDRYLATKKTAGAPVGERYFLLDRATDAPRTLRRILYEPEPPRCLSVRESGEVVVAPELRDFLIGSELAAFCDATDSEYHWWLTPESVRRAASSGWTAVGILEVLTRRASAPLPPLIAFALRAWVGGPGKPGPLSIPDAPVLLVTDEVVASAIWRTATFRKFFVGRLGGWSFLVHPERVEELKERLAHFGLSPGCEILDTRGMA